MTKYFFRSVFPQHVVLQLFDAYMLEGRKILFRFTLSIMEECYKKLRNTKKSTSTNDNINLHALLNTLSDLRMMPNKTKNRIFKRAYGYRLRRQQINVLPKIQFKIERHQVLPRRLFRCCKANFWESYDQRFCR